MIISIAIYSIYSFLYKKRYVEILAIKSKNIRGRNFKTIIYHRNIRLLNLYDDITL